LVGKIIAVPVNVDVEVADEKGWTYPPFHMEFAYFTDGPFRSVSASAAQPHVFCIFDGESNLVAKVNLASVFNQIAEAWPLEEEAPQT
jgi:hypothetical protein